MKKGDQNSEKCDNIFVYGTLQHGQSRNEVLQHLKYEKAILLNHRKISPPNLGFPFIIYDKNSHVNGEVYYGLNADLFQSLDLIEGEGSLYNRILVEVITEKGEKLQVYTYYPSKKLIKNYIKYT
jgi:gamma-glutamylcyclotransferase (GGCT)/AIG2-like uncharacterized protein YtfP